MDIVASTLGSIAVLIVGTIWRRKKLAEANHAELKEAQTAE
jgi:heme exporter protein D